MEQPVHDETFFNLISNLKDVISECQKQNYQALQLNRKLREDCAKVFSETEIQNLAPCRSTNLTCNKGRKKSKSSPSISERDCLIHMIREATNENFQLRESNVNLQRQSKLQDNKIKDLKYQISRQGQKATRQRVNENKIEKLRVVISGNIFEIQKLKYEINSVQHQLSSGKVDKKVRSVHPKKTPSSKEKCEPLLVTSGDKVRGKPNLTLLASKLHRELDILCNLPSNHRQDDSTSSPVLTEIKSSLVAILEDFKTKSTGKGTESNVSVEKAFAISLNEISEIDSANLKVQDEQRLQEQTVLESTAKSDGSEEFYLADTF